MLFPTLSAPVKTLDLATVTASTLAAFLRGIERRAAVLAELQCGDAVQGDRALGEAFEAFVAVAGALPESDWTLQFWAHLLQSPTLGAEPLAPFWEGDFAPLARLDAGPRAALLLRVVAGLNEQDAATVFGVDPADYRQSLQQALPQRADGTLDGEAWLALNDEARRTMTTQSPERLAAIARVRDAAVAASTPEQAPRREGIGGTASLTGTRWLNKLLTGIGLH